MLGGEDFRQLLIDKVSRCWSWFLGRGRRNLEGERGKGREESS